MKLTIFVSLLSLLLVSCATTTSHSNSEGDDEIGAQVEQGPILDGDQIEAQETESPAIPEQESKTTETPKELNCLVLGAGMAKAFAQVGAIEVLQDQFVNLNCIVGVEMGAVIGALYAEKRNINAVKWQIFKLKRENYLDYKFLSLGPKRASGEKFNQFLKEIFGDKTGRDLGLERFIVVSADAQSNTLAIDESLKLSDSLSATVALPGIFAPWALPNGKKLQSGAALSALPIEIARGLGANRIWAIDVLSLSSSVPSEDSSELAIAKYFEPVIKLAKVQTEDVSEIWRINTKNYAYWDLSKHGELFTVGKEGATPDLPRSLPGQLKSASENEDKK